MMSRTKRMMSRTKRTKRPRRPQTLHQLRQAPRRAVSRRPLPEHRRTPELRFTETNCHKQCQPCNTHLHGNLVLYRVALIEKVGMAEVAFLEGPHTPAKWTVDDLKAIKAEYKNALKELNHG